MRLAPKPRDKNLGDLVLSRIAEISIFLHFLVVSQECGSFSWISQQHSLLHATTCLCVICNRCLPLSCCCALDSVTCSLSAVCSCLCNVDMNQGASPCPSCFCVCNVALGGWIFQNCQAIEVNYWSTSIFNVPMTLTKWMQTKHLEDLLASKHKQHSVTWLILMQHSKLESFTTA
jgi:hypothetical protein